MSYCRLCIVVCDPVVVCLQVALILVLVRWVMGFIFPKKDLRYLDTALPKWMYKCPSPCCKKQKAKDLSRGLEMGNLMVYEEEPYQRPTTAVSASTVTATAYGCRLAGSRHVPFCHLRNLLVPLQLHFIHISELPLQNGPPLTNVA